MTERDVDEVIVPATQEVRVYMNAVGEVVIDRDLQPFERHVSPEDKTVAIFIPKLYVPALIERLRALLAEGS